jgi:hypothetical protein
LGKYILIYSGDPNEARVAAGVAIMIKTEPKNKIIDYRAITQDYKTEN